MRVVEFKLSCNKHDCWLSLLESTNCRLLHGMQCSMTTQRACCRSCVTSGVQAACRPAAWHAPQADIDVHALQACCYACRLDRPTGMQCRMICMQDIPILTWVLYCLSRKSQQARRIHSGMLAWLQAQCCGMQSGGELPRAPFCIAPSNI
jgi:hypothetical protein